MLVIADSSPLVALINIGHVEILPTLFGVVVVPPEVMHELAGSKRAQTVRTFSLSRPSWLQERVPAATRPIAGLHPGELAAISLAEELNADLLLIDEARGRRVASARHVPITGTVGVLELAADAGLLDLQSAFARLKDTDFWISPELLDRRLKMYVERRKSQ